MLTTPVLTAAVLIAVGALVLLVQRFVLAGRRHVWLGGLLPVAWVAASLAVLVRDDVPGWRPWLALVLGLVTLLGLWDDGHRARARRPAGPAQPAALPRA
ncbi:hypothetical protein GTR02_09135 [Kineococcus sp. R8]|uniref:hypothetical protein n=1 Tax=Kineococcus siccus TaxID=2696567 RepID=UPI00141256A6|nr:hypothetical protein [Kineococcus siccus]NAZ81982.1 hypothetical protein [Kineococcus siccus]